MGLALFLTIFIMSPVITDVYEQAIQPYSAGAIGFDAALTAAETPVRNFMLNQTRETDIAMFAEIARNSSLVEPADVPFTTLVPAYITSELKSALRLVF